MIHKKSFLRITWKSVGLVPIVVLLTIISAIAASVEINWSPNVPPPEGYRVFARRSDQCFDYSQPVWEGRQTTCTIDGLEDQMDYYFVVQPFDGDLEGEFSAEIHYETSETSNPEMGIDADEESHTRRDHMADQPDENGFIGGEALENRQIPRPSNPLSAEYAVGDKYYLMLIIEAYSTDNGNSPAATHWQIYETQTGNCVLDLVSDRQMSKLRVSTLPLDHGIIYNWRARFFDHRGRVSDWSKAAFFTLNTESDGTSECNRPT